MIKVLSLLLPASYLIGSVPFALIVGRLLKGIDIREYGSGNAGATNVYRIMGLPAALAVMILDICKGFFPVFFVSRFYQIISENGIPGYLQLDLLRLVCLSFLIIGHAFPLWAGFKGGKSVAVSAGGISALVPLMAPFCLLIFIMTLFVSRIVSLGSITTAWFLPLFYMIGFKTGYFRQSNPILIFFIVLALAITVLHRKNIARIMAGTEPRLGNRKEE